jgi:exodeoxyribonuclease V gamma subunit
VLDDGRTVTGTVAGVRGDALVTTIYSRVGPKHRLAAWVRLLALSAAHPERPWSALTVGRAREGDGMTVAAIPPLGADGATRRAEALELLGELIDLYDRALCEPLPIACKATAAYARALREGADADAAARDAWQGSYNWPGEADEPEHVLVFGRGRSFDELCAEDPRADERGPGWEPGEATRFGRYAARLWTDLLDVEEVADR